MNFSFKSIPPYGWILLGLLTAVIGLLLPWVMVFMGNGWVYVWESGKFTYSSSAGILLSLVCMYCAVLGLRETRK